VRSAPSRLLLSATVQLQHWWIDERLAQGEDPAASAQLALRAQQLLSPKVRLELARQLCRVVEEAEGPPQPFSAAVPVQREPVLRARECLVELADDLAFGSEINARGVALVERLLRDGASPLYAPPVYDTVERAVRHARVALLVG
jgi:hypothetical protein